MMKRLAIKAVAAIAILGGAAAAWHYTANDWQSMPLGNILDDQGRAWGENGVKVPIIVDVDTGGLERTIDGKYIAGYEIVHP